MKGILSESIHFTDTLYIVYLGGKKVYSNKLTCRKSSIVRPEASSLRQTGSYTKLSIICQFAMECHLSFSFLITAVCFIYFAIITSEEVKQLMNIQDVRNCNIIHYISSYFLMKETKQIFKTNFNPIYDTQPVRHHIRPMVGCIK